MKFSKIHFILFAFIFTLISCKDEETDNVQEIPTTYNFSNVDFSGQTERLNQLDEFAAYFKSVDKGAKIETQVMLDMFANTNENGNGNFSFSSTKQLKDKTAPQAIETLESFMSSLAEISGTTEEGSLGKAGIVKSGTKQYLFNENGVEYQQLIEKGLMGACFLHQITNVYLSPDKMNVENNTNSEGKNYTAMEHHWDEAFGYLGATTNWPQDLTGERYWAKYTHKSNSDVTNGLMDSPQDITTSFIKGRIAIQNKDYTERDKQIDIIINQLEVIAATTALNYVNTSLNNFNDDAIRNHALSEAYAFIWGLNFINFQKRAITQSQINNLLDILGLNYYEVSITQLNTLRDEIAKIYNLDNIKTNF